MTIESLPGSVTAPDPLEVENDALREDVKARNRRYAAESGARAKARRMVVDRTGVRR